jgi:hypothetical protein
MQNGRSTVCGTIVNYDELQFCMGLRKNTLDRALNISFGVIGGHDNGNLKDSVLFHRRSSFL